MNVKNRSLLVALACTSMAMLANCERVSITSLCDLAGRADSRPGQDVRIHGIYITDLKHITIMKDRRCPEVSLAIDDSSSKDVDSTVKQFDRAVYGDISDLDLRIFDVDVVGTLRWDTESDHHSVLAIRQVKSFHRLRGNDWQNAK